MKSNPRIVVSYIRKAKLAELIVCSLSLAMVSSTANAQTVASDKPVSAERAVYENDELFNQLSGAARARAELKFGKKQTKKLAPKGSNFDDANPVNGPYGLEKNFLLGNLQVNDPTSDATAQDTQSDTALVLGTGSNIVCAFFDTGPFNSVSNPKLTGFSQSSNLAASWTDKGSLSTTTDGDAGDPVLAQSTKTGTILLSTLSFNTPEKLLVWRSTNNGVSFTGPINGAPGFDLASGDHDKEWLVVDNFAGTGQGNAYLFWRNFGTPGGMTLTKSTDDGLTWGPNLGNLIANPGQGGQVVVGNDHAVYAFWYNSSTTPAKISLRKSTDFGVNFAGSIDVTTFVGTGANGDLDLGAFRSTSYPQVVVNPVSGYLYIVYPDATQASGGDRGNIYWRQSTNGGTTWSAAVKINDDNTLRAQFQPAIAVRPDGTGLAVSWYDRRRDPADSLIERWCATATISGTTVTWGPNFRVSPQFPAVYGVDPAANPYYMSDYDQMAADNNYFYTTWGDNRDTSTAVPSRKNANVRSAKFPLAGPGPILDSEAVIISAGNGNGVVDANECNSLTLVIRNNGSTTASNISATITSSTPGITIAQASSSYPDVPAGATGTNATLFKIFTSSTYVCGTTVNINLALTYAGGGADTAAFSVPGAGYSISRTNGAAIVAGTIPTGNHGDDDVTTIALPFGYNFYGQYFSNVSVCANGHLQFDTTLSDYDNACLPASGFSYAMFPFWDDLRTDGTMGVPQGIFTSTSGSTPNRIFNIEWRGSYYSDLSNGAPVNFEVRLYEGQQRADFVYGAVNGDGSSATVGIQHGSTFSQFSCNTSSLSNGLLVTFAPSCLDGGGACTIPPPTITTPKHIGNNFVFSFLSVAGRTYVVQYKDNLPDPTWLTNQVIAGDGSFKFVTNSILSPSRRFYRLMVP